MAIAEKINVPVPEELLSTDKEEETRNKETLRQEMIIEKRQYIAKIELGKMISCIIDEEHIPELCLNKEKQEALLGFRRRQNSPIASYCQIALPTQNIIQCIDCGKHLSIRSIDYHKKNSCKAK